VKFNRTGYFLIAFFGGVGVILFVIGLVVPETAFVLLPLGGIWVLGTLGLIVYARRQSKKADHERWLFENGIRGSATLVRASSNSAINDQPVMKLELDVQVPGQAPRRVGHKLLMSNFAAYRMRPGVILPIHVNPRNANDLLVRW
jgi:hypothetical protein